MVSLPGAPLTAGFAAALALAAGLALAAALAAALPAGLALALAAGDAGALAAGFAGAELAEAAGGALAGVAAPPPQAARSRPGARMRALMRGMKLTEGASYAFLASHSTPGSKRGRLIYILRGDK